MSNTLFDGLWLSISEIARLKGVSRQAIAKRIGSLTAHGLLDVQPGQNGSKLINLAQFDRAVGEVGDAIKEGAAETRAEMAAEVPGRPRCAITKRGLPSMPQT
jgi:DNA-binding IscR family transcriptional regulator